MLTSSAATAAASSIFALSHWWNRDRNKMEKTRRAWVGTKPLHNPAEPGQAKCCDCNDGRESFEDT